MKKIIVLIVLLWGLLLVAGTAHLFAQISSEIRWGEVEERIANAPSARDYPLADALILLEKRNIKLNSDGSVVDRHYRLVKIFTEVGRSLFADPRFDFNKATQEVKILTARTHMRDGKVVDVPENAINLLTPFSVSKAPAYCNLQQWVVSHTALETDAVIELEVETTTQSDPQNYLFGEVLFNSYYPVLEKEFTITLPTSIELNYVFKPKAIQPLTKEENGFRSYTWKLKDLVAIPLEKDGASLKELSQRLLYSTCPSWDTIVAKFRQNFVSALPLSVEAKGKVAALTKNANDVGEKLAAIHSYFLEEVNAVKCDPSLLNYKIRPLEEIYRSNYGHSLDEAALLVAMLEEAGIPANLALVADAGLFSKAIASSKQFQDIWVVATVDGQEVWLHPQHKRSENRRLLSGKTALRIDKDGYSFVDIPYSGAAENGIGLFCTLNLGEGGKGEGKATLKLTGYFNPCYLMQSEEEKKEYFTKVVANMFKNAEVKDYDLRLLTPTATEVALSFEVSNLTSETDRYVYLSLKNPYLFSYDFDISLIREKRQTPLELPTTFQTDLKALIRFPEQWKVIYLPEGIDLENEVASLWVHYAAESSQISIAKRLTVKNRNVSAEDYPKLRSLLLSGGIEKSNTVIFRLP